MQNTLRISVLVALVGWWSMAVAEETARPRLVAPGAGPEVAVVESRCPTFHWSGIPAAERYELVVYRAEDDAPEPRERFRVPLPGDARSWTPTVDRCLDAAGRYAWSVGAVGGDEAESWSEVGVFEVAARPSIVEVEEAMAVLRRYLGREAGSSSPDPDAPVPALPLESRASGPALPPVAPAAGGPASDATTGAQSQRPPDANASLEGPHQPVYDVPAFPSLVVDSQIHLIGDSAVIYKFAQNQWHRVMWDDPGQNQSLGRRSLLNLEIGKGNGNTALGYAALGTLAQGGGNVAVGSNAGNELTGSLGNQANNNILIANNGVCRAGEVCDRFTIRIGQQNLHAFTYLAGKLALGFTDADDEGVAVADQKQPEAQLVVRSSRDGNAVNEAANVVWFENTDSDGGGSDVLALKINEVSAENDNNFITFLNSNDNSLGAIEGDGAGGVTTASSGADYAEFLERLDGEAPMAAGDVVGLFGRRISRATAGADRVMVISTAPIVLGNDPGREHREGWEKVALLGQAPVSVVGPVRAGDLLVASGRGDGTAVARRPAALAVEELPGVLGRALESSEEPGETKVLALVGAPDPALLGQMMKSWERALLERFGTAEGDEPAAAADDSRGSEDSSPPVSTAGESPASRIPVARLPDRVRLPGARQPLPPGDSAGQGEDAESAASIPSRVPRIPGVRDLQPTVSILPPEREAPARSAPEPDSSEPAGPRISGPPRLSGLTGREADIVKRVDFEDRAIDSLQWGEQLDKPCELRVIDRDAERRSMLATINQCSEKGFECEDEPCLKDSIGRPYDQVVRLSPNEAVTAAQVCLNSSGARVKGIEIRGGRILDDGSVDPVGSSDRDRLPNCSAWQTLVFCPARHVATGVLAHFRKGRPPSPNVDALTGLQLVCREPRTTPAG